MDPLSALAIAAAVVQFAEFGSKILKRTWDKYLIVYKSSDAAYHIAQESSDLTALTKELSELAKAVQVNSDEVVAGGSVAESQLLKLCTECESIETEFKTVLNKIDNRKRRTIGKDDERAKNKIPRLALAGLWDRRKIDEMDSRLQALQKQIMNCIIFCLW
jgi:predicted RNase H-like nuclease (RuvC/YqgF family)